jgi:hypothetical protein
MPALYHNLFTCQAIFDGRHGTDHGAKKKSAMFFSTASKAAIKN